MIEIGDKSLNAVKHNMTDQITIEPPAVSSSAEQQYLSADSQERLQFEKLIVDISRRFINVDLEEINHEIKITLGNVGK